jgi:hypothetical protein
VILLANTKLTLGQRWHRLRTSRRFPLMLLLGILFLGALAQVYYYWWAVRIERMLNRNQGRSIKMDIYPGTIKKYLGQKFVGRFEPIQRVYVYFRPATERTGYTHDLALLRGALFLEEMQISGPLTEDDVLHLKQLTTLQRVHAWDDSKSVIEGVHQLPQLELLNVLFQNRPDPVVFQQIAAMPRLEKLRTFWPGRGHAQSTVEGMRALATSQSLYQLETRLENNEFLALTDLLPDGSPPLPELRELRIQNSNVALASMDNLKNLPDLIHLDMTGWKISHEHLIPLRQLRHLRTLYLEENRKLTDAAVDILISLPNLQSLNVKQTAITDEGLVRLATIRRLRCLRAHPRTAAARIAIRQQLPADCEFDTN